MLKCGNSAAWNFTLPENFRELAARDWVMDVRGKGVCEMLVGAKIRKVVVWKYGSSYNEVNSDGDYEVIYLVSFLNGFCRRNSKYLRFLVKWIDYCTMTLKLVAKKYLKEKE